MDLLFSLSGLDPLVLRMPGSQEMQIEFILRESILLRRIKSPNESNEYEKYYRLHASLFRHSYPSIILGDELSHIGPKTHLTVPGGVPGYYHSITNNAHATVCATKAILVKRENISFNQTSSCLVQQIACTSTRVRISSLHINALMTDTEALLLPNQFYVIFSRCQEFRVSPPSFEFLAYINTGLRLHSFKHNCVANCFPASMFLSFFKHQQLLHSASMVM